MGRTVKSQTESSRKTALLFGFGYSAKALAPYLKKAGFDITGTVRSPEKAEKLSELSSLNIIPFAGHANEALLRAVSDADIILSSIPPADDGTDQVLTAIPDLAVRAKKCRWAGYLSATSVYGDRQGRWAFEDERLYPTTRRGKNRILAELAWLESNLPVHVFRLAGIYGPKIMEQSRNAFDRLRMGRAKAVIKPGHVVNRIHVEDIATAVLASLQDPDPGQIYNLADGNPAPPQDVLDFAADLIGEARPPHINFDEAQLSGMARSFYTETKRVDNSRVTRELAWTPKFPSFRHGLCDIYRTETFGAKAFLLAGHIIVPPENLETLREELPKHKAATLAEPGCLRFDVFQDLKNKYKFHVFEVFKSEKAFQAHKKRMQGTAWAKASQNIDRFYTVSKYQDL